jgi:hypothetical protein
LLREYEDLFPKTNSELKGIKGDLGEMKIELNPNYNPIKYRPYRLNSRVQEKVKKEIDRMLAIGLIFHVDEDEWISPMVIQSNKGIDDIIFCVDYRSLNFTYVHDTFPTHFSDEVLDQVAGNTTYYFIDGFSGYHQVRIAKEDKRNTNFTMEWG